MFDEAIVNLAKHYGRCYPFEQVKIFEGIVTINVMKREFKEVEEYKGPGGCWQTLDSKFLLFELPAAEEDTWEYFLLYVGKP